jgi:hypothetical protein
VPTPFNQIRQDLPAYNAEEQATILREFLRLDFAIDPDLPDSDLTFQQRAIKAHVLNLPPPVSQELDALEAERPLWGAILAILAVYSIAMVIAWAVRLFRDGKLRVPQLMKPKPAYVIAVLAIAAFAAMAYYDAPFPGRYKTMERPYLVFDSWTGKVWRFQEGQGWRVMGQ